MNRKIFIKTLLPDPDKPEPKKIGLIFSRKITKEKKKIYITFVLFVYFVV